MKIYVAGPMRGYPEFNFPAFDKATRNLRLGGHEVFNPAEQDREEYGDLTPENADDKGFDLRKALRLDLSWIADNADAVFMLEGWELSAGAKAEKALADALGLKVYLPGDRRPAPLPNVAIKSGAADEVRTTSSTGGEKGVKPARFDLIPAGPLTAVAEHYGRGAAKYADRNWERGYEWSKSFGALMRHAWQFWNGENIDEETQSHHMAAVTFHALALIEFGRTHPEFDDRVVS